MSAVASFAGKLKRTIGDHIAPIVVVLAIVLPAIAGFLVGREGSSPKDLPTPVSTAAFAPAPPRFATLPPLRAPLVHPPAGGKAPKSKGAEKDKQSPPPGGGGGSDTTTTLTPPPPEPEKPVLTPEPESSKPVFVPERKGVK